jgi:RNase H-fold protein (predicted Holliday junction resolvase)
MIFEKIEEIPKMRILALDHGTKRIGVAVSDEMKMIAPSTYGALNVLTCHAAN